MATIEQRHALRGAGVPDTPLVQAAIKFAKDHLSEHGFNHVMRSCGFAFCIASKRYDSKNMDDEVLAVSAILHDMGWDTTGTLVSPDKRFEVDGAEAAYRFLQREAPDWEKRRLQLVWDAIALHTTVSIALFKETEVAACSRGITADFGGPDGTPDGGLTWHDYNPIVKAFPRHGFTDAVKEILCGFCRIKPLTTYDNFLVQVGEKWVEGYSTKGYTFPERLVNKTKALEND